MKGFIRAGIASLLLTLSIQPLQAFTEQQIEYQQVRDWQRNGKWKQADKALSELEDYVLYPYLKYYQLKGNLTRVKRQEVESFLRAYPNYYLSDALERRFLLELARRKDWAGFLAFYPRQPASTDLRCHHFVAHYQQGNLEQAWQGAEQMWLYGKSRPKACDPLFEAWKKAGKLTDQLRWERMLLAFDARKPSLMNYLARPFDGSLAVDAKLLEQAYKQPNGLLESSKLTMSKARHQQIASLAIKRLARSDVEQAIAHWQRFDAQIQQQPPLYQVSTRYLVQRVIGKKAEPLMPWADKQLAWLEDSDSIERRLRLAVTQQQWSEVLRWTARLPDEVKKKDRWLYWEARSYAEQGQMPLARRIWQQLANERSYYGFMAAQQLDLAPNLREQRHEVSPLRLQQLSEHPPVQRVSELYSLSQIVSARSEWMSLMRSVPPSVMLDYGRVAEDKGWHDLSVQSAIVGKQWDQLELRFPLSYSDEFRRFADMRKVDHSLLIAVARQESALYPRAVSSAGARGLMQLMPATAQETAKKIGFRYASRSQLYTPEDNIRLGSAYLQQLLKRYQGNRILATAAYNAGPHRVSRWLDERGDVPADVWVESIPFRETRFYVQNVLAYQVIYQHRLKQRPTQVLLDSELKYAYGG